MTAIATLSKDGKTITVDVSQLRDNQGSGPAIVNYINKVVFYSDSELSFILDQTSGVIEGKKQAAVYRKANPKKEKTTSGEYWIKKQEAVLSEERFGFTSDEVANWKASGFLGTDEAHDLIGDLMRKVDGATEKVRAKLTPSA